MKMRRSVASLLVLGIIIALVQHTHAYTPVTLTPRATAFYTPQHLHLTPHRSVRHGYASCTTQSNQGIFSLMLEARDSLFSVLNGSSLINQQLSSNKLVSEDLVNIRSEPSNSADAASMQSSKQLSGVLSANSESGQFNKVAVSEISPNLTIPVTILSHEDKPKQSIAKSILKFASKNWLVLGEVLVIILAKMNPEFGATGGVLRPEFTISKVGVFLIFFINGIALTLSGDGDNMPQTMKTNILIQLYNYAFIPILFKAFARYYPEPLFREGLLVLAALPMTINICVAQTNAVGGNMRTAIFNAIFSNVVGVVLTPLLAVWLLGTGKDVSLLGTLRKLGVVVILPLVAGQLARKTPLLAIADKVSSKSRTLSSLLLLAIVYNVFSDTFKSGLGVGGSALAGLIVSMPILYLSLSYVFWEVSKKFLPGLDARTRSAALFCSSQKTLAFGIPFIKTALGHRPDLAYILAPLLMYAPAQLLLGSSLLVPAMQKLIAKEDANTEGSGI